MFPLFCYHSSNHWIHSVKAGLRNKTGHITRIQSAPEHTTSPSYHSTGSSKHLLLMLPKLRALRASHFPMSHIEHEEEKQPGCCDSLKAAQAPQSQQPPFVSVQPDELAPLSGKQTSWGFPCCCQLRPAREVCLSLLSRNKCLGSAGSSSAE